MIVILKSKLIASGKKQLSIKSSTWQTCVQVDALSSFYFMRLSSIALFDGGLWAYRSVRCRTSSLASRHEVYIPGGHDELSTLSRRGGWVAWPLGTIVPGRIFLPPNRAASLGRWRTQIDSTLPVTLINPV